MSANTNMWIEPVIVDADNPPKYPYNNIQTSESGHSIEMDDTPGKERVRIQHRSNTFTEMQPNGDMVTKVYNDNYQIIAANNNVLITGQCNITVKGACVIHIMNDSLIQVDGNLQQIVNGNIDQICNGSISISGTNDIDISSAGDISLLGQNVNIEADLNVNGGITSSASISALGNIEAGKQSSAMLGFVTPGFISAGAAVPLFPVPGWISGIVVRDLVRSIEEDRLIYDIHSHGGVKSGGSTTTFPLQSE